MVLGASSAVPAHQMLSTQSNVAAFHTHLQTCGVFSCGIRGSFVPGIAVSPCRHVPLGRRLHVKRQRATPRATLSAPNQEERHEDSQTNSSVYEQIISVLPLSTVFREMLGEDALKPGSQPNTYKVVCPFHDDKNPSLELSDEKKVWHCFGCGASGNLFTLERLWHDIERVPDAIASLAKRYPTVARIVSASGQRRRSHGNGRNQGSAGTASYGSRSSYQMEPYSRVTSPPLPPARAWGDTLRKRDSAFSVLAAAQEYFVAALLESEEACSYLEQRGISEDTTLTFGFGYAPGFDSKMQGCLTAMKALGFDEEECIAAGIAKRDRQGRVYDVFRDRLVLPIRDSEGQVISFAGRLLVHSETAPKYINGPNSPVFSKKEALFGADIARHAENSSAQMEFGMLVLVEGYMDVVALHNGSAGQLSCVASMGTAVSEEQIKAAIGLLGDVVDGKLVINLDGDSAGLAAAERMCDATLCGMPDVSCVYIAEPPEHVKDVGEYFEVGGDEVSGESYRKYLDQTALPWIEWRVRRIMKEVLDSRNSVRSAVQVAQAAELGSRNDGDDDDEGRWRDAERDITGVSQTAFMSEKMRHETLLLLDSMAGEDEDRDASSVDFRGVSSSTGGNEREGREGDSIKAQSSKKRQQRRAASLAGTSRTEKPDTGSDEGARSIAGCPISVLDDIGIFLGKALRMSPGFNFPWYAHRWADLLSDGVTKRVPILYDAITASVDRQISSWSSNSPANLIDHMPLPQWIVDELPKFQRASMRASVGKEKDGSKHASMATFYSDKRRRKASQERKALQDKYLMPIIRQARSPISLQLRESPRAAAEELILRALIRAQGDSRLEALEVLVEVMIRIEEAGLLPFWTAASRAALFEYLVDVDGELSVEQIAAECENCSWWDRNLELLFVPIEEFGDAELTSIRELEERDPVATVLEGASCIEEMTRAVATGRAVDQLGEFMETKLGEGGDASASRVKELVDAVSGVAYLSSAELSELQMADEEFQKKQDDQDRLREFEAQLMREEFSYIPEGSLLDSQPTDDVE